MQPSFLKLADGRKLAHHLTEGKSPGVIFMGGFKSDMNGAKATALETYCVKHGHRFVRFDYTGHGESSGKFEDGTISAWKQDALDIFDKLGAGKNILIGSSMGAWLALLVALERPEKISGIVGIASAPDFTENLVWQALTPAQQKKLLEKGQVLIPDCYGEAPYPITRALVEDGRKHLLLDKEIPIHVPVRLIHGTEDNDVPWQVSVTLIEKLATPDVRLQLIKNGDHRLSEPQHLFSIALVVKELLDVYKNVILAE